MANASKKHGMGAGTVTGHQGVGTTDPAIPDEDDLAGQIAKAERLNSHDRPRFQHQRTTLPGSQDLRNQPEEAISAIEAESEADESTS